MTIYDLLFPHDRSSRKFTRESDDRYAKNDTPTRDDKRGDLHNDIRGGLV